jgi:hypothetical protein
MMLDIITRHLEAAQSGGDTRPGIGVEEAAESLFWFTHGLVGPLLVGLYTPEQALTLLDRQLHQVFN